MPRPQAPFKSFLWKLFTLNAEQRLSDSELADLIREHFPESLLDRRVGRHRNRLGIWRSDYNRGRLHYPPKVFACSYYNRQPVDAYGRRLSPEFIELQRLKFYGIVANAPREEEKKDSS